MSIELEKVDLLKERAKVTYKEAKEALEKTDGDLLEALVYLEEHGEKQEETSTERSSDQKDVWQRIKAWLVELHETKLLIKNDDHKVVDMPLSIALLITLVTLPVSLFVWLVPLVLGYGIRFIKPSGKEVSADELVKDMSKEV